MKTRVFTVCAVIFLFCGIVNAEINDGLVAYYPFNGNTNDESGNGHNGIVNGTGATLTNDRFGNANKAYSFNGTGSYIRVNVNTADWFYNDFVESTCELKRPVNAPAGIFSGLVKLSEIPGETVNVFLGIPFAESVSGNKRWTNPVAKAYLGHFNAKAFGPVCPQDTTWGARISDMPQCEDCLTLNVWTPSGTPPHGGFPVMFYIYGGAYIHGGTSDPLFDGVSLVASQDVILVTANYRIGALGFLAGKIGNATFTGNYGILDQQLAMKWVQKNISAFGGNPANVTLFGESAGAISVSLHLLSIPLSAPLFKAAIIESDPAGAPMALPYRTQQIAEAFAKNLGCDKSDDPFKCLLTIDPGSLAKTPSIIAAQQSPDVISTGEKQGLGVFLMWAPYVDGQLVVRQILDGAMSGDLNKPTIRGTNRNEVPVFTTAIPKDIFSEACYSQLIPFYLGVAKGANVLAQIPYTPSNDAALNKDAFVNILESRVFHCASQVAVRQNGAPDPYPNVYAYLFTHHSEWESNTLFKTTPECGEPGAACHEAELPYVFNTPGVFVDQRNRHVHFTPGEAKLSAAMQTYWGNFAKNQDPNIGNPVPKPWPKFATGAKKTTYLILDTPPGTQDALPSDCQCDFWDAIGWVPPVLGNLPQNCSGPPVGGTPVGVPSGPLVGWVRGSHLTVTNNISKTIQVSRGINEISWTPLGNGESTVFFDGWSYGETGVDLSLLIDSSSGTQEISFGVLNPVVDYPSFTSYLKSFPILQDHGSIMSEAETRGFDYTDPKDKTPFVHFFVQRLWDDNNNKNWSLVMASPLGITTPPDEPLNISAFRDITAFILETAASEHLIQAKIKYVQNADEAHSDLTSKNADLVFMSYDDTLSLALESKYQDIAAIAPVHGGILNLCGSIDLNAKQNKIGIDTNSGYARALRYYLHKRYSDPADYQQLQWIFAGATNLRLTKLLNHEIDATLLNPPYSYQTGVTRMIRMYDAIGSYQGVVINLNKSWSAESANQLRVKNFLTGFYSRISEMKNNPEKTIPQLVAYYNLNTLEATDTYNALWGNDGLNLAPQFNAAQLSGAEMIFHGDNGIVIPAIRSWVIDWGK